MDIPFPFDFPENKTTFMRRASYAAFTDPKTGSSSYVKRLRGDFYPRFHVYLETDKDNRSFISLHLDQKQASYEGSHAHSAEYDGLVVETEGKRLQGLIKNQMDNFKQNKKNQPESQGFFSKLFK